MQCWHGTLKLTHIAASMKDISKTESKKDCFANCSDANLLINLKWWFHDHWLPLNCFLQDHAMCLFWTATPICCIIARSKWNKVETNCRRQIQELYLTDVTDQFVLWFLIVNKSMEWNVLSEASLLTSPHSAQKLPLCLPALWKFQQLMLNKRKIATKTIKAQSMGNTGWVMERKEKKRLKINGKWMNKKYVALGRLGYEINCRMKKKTDKIMTIRNNDDKWI